MLRRSFGHKEARSLLDVVASEKRRVKSLNFYYFFVIYFLDNTFNDQLPVY